MLSVSGCLDQGRDGEVREGEAQSQAQGQVERRGKRAESPYIRQGQTPHPRTNFEVDFIHDGESGTIPHNSVPHRLRRISEQILTKNEGALHKAHILYNQNGGVV